LKYTANIHNKTGKSKGGGELGVES